MENVTIAALDDPTSTPTTVPYSDVLRHPELYYNGADIAWVMTASALVFISTRARGLLQGFSQAHRSSEIARTNEADVFPQ